MNLRSERLTEAIIGAAIEVHREMGPGLYEAIYEECLCDDLSLRGLKFRRQVPQPVVYKGRELGCGYKIDVVVESEVLLELKAVEAVLPVHEAQLMSYLKLSGIRTGLLFNFNVVMMKDGITRRVM